MKLLQERVARSEASGETVTGMSGQECMLDSDWRLRHGDLGTVAVWDGVRPVAALLLARQRLLDNEDESVPVEQRQRRQPR